MPFYSADGRSLGFWLPAVGVASVSASGGTARTACAIWGAGGAAWLPDGAVLLGGSNRGLTRCVSGSAKPEELTTIDKSGQVLGHQEPQLLPDGRVLFVIEHVSTNEEQRQVGLLDLQTGKVTVVRRRVTSPKYVAPGYLTYVRSGVLYAERVDVKTLAQIGNAHRLASGFVNLAGDPFFYRHARYDMSARGPLVYEPASSIEAELSWVERSGSGAPRHPNGRAIRASHCRRMVSGRPLA